MNIYESNTDAADLPFDAASFDAIISECSLSAMPTQRVLQECNRVLKPSGKVLISDIYVRQKPPITRWDSLDANLLLQNEWVELLEQSGFADIQFVDRSKALTEFLVKAIWEHGSLEDILDCRQWSRIKPAKPGYFLAVATKDVRK
ncbi:MAG: class I SAM-dependent methyltransferase [Pelotomaculum sp.]|jgi:SAM-dependent methyltransferase